MRNDYDPLMRTFNGNLFKISGGYYFAETVIEILAVGVNAPLSIRFNSP